MDSNHFFVTNYPNFEVYFFKNDFCGYTEKKIETVFEKLKMNKKYQELMKNIRS